MDLLFKNFPYFMEVYFNFSLSEYLITLSLCGFLALVIYALINGERQALKEIAIVLLFAIYLSAVIGITLLNKNRGNVRQLILNPMSELQLRLNVHLVRGMASNFIMFFPFGVFISMYIEKHLISATLIWGVAVSVAIETLQYLFCRGTTETLDVICNVAGALCGALVFRGAIVLIKSQ